MKALQGTPLKNCLIFIVTKINRNIRSAEKIFHLHLNEITPQFYPTKKWQLTKENKTCESSERHALKKLLHFYYHKNQSLHKKF